MDQSKQNIQEVIQNSLQSSPEEMLEKCLNILIKVSGATGGSILGEEGPALKFLFSDVESLIGMSVPWDSLAGSSVSQGLVIYTYAPKDDRHFDGIDADLAGQTNYMLSLPIPSIHRSSDKEQQQTQNAGALQLLFDHDIFPEFDVSNGAREFTIDELNTLNDCATGFQEVTMILPNIAFGLEVMRLRQTSYQAIHELKNKLIGATSWINCLKEDLEDISPEALEDESIQEDLQLAESAVTAGSALAVSYLQFTKIYNPVFEDANLNDVLKEAAANIKAFATQNGGKQLAVNSDFDDAIPTRQLDGAQLTMAFFNIGKNAAEALIEHGVENPEISITSTFHDDQITVVMSDNGKGMPKEIADNLFVAFKTKKQGGTGLGLTITKKIIDVHNGRIKCETGSNGTSFTILL